MNDFAAAYRMSRSKVYRLIREFMAAEGIARRCPPVTGHWLIFPHLFEARLPASSA